MFGFFISSFWFLISRLRFGVRGVECGGWRVVWGSDLLLELAGRVRALAALEAVGHGCGDHGRAYHVVTLRGSPELSMLPPYTPRPIRFDAPPCLGLGVQSRLNPRRNRLRALAQSMLQGGSLASSTLKAVGHGCGDHGRPHHVVTLRGRGWVNELNQTKVCEPFYEPAPKPRPSTSGNSRISDLGLCES